MENARLTEVKTSAVEQRDFNGQAQLFELPLPPLSWPTPGTLGSICHEILLTGKPLMPPRFQAATQSWRLAAYIDRLPKRHRWPIERRDLANCCPTRRSRDIREYQIRLAEVAAFVEGRT